MKNSFSEYLLMNGWKAINPMMFQNGAKPECEIFFDTSNQIELYIDNKRKDGRYIMDLLELIEFLMINNLLDKK